ncbi:MAG TPA: hypothetical protein VNQ73_20860 [Ilumatobacter sp.]|nr:hypothetical protein [Ilumatobacter sp.]
MTPWPRSLAGYVPELRAADDEWRLRVILHEFGLLWETTTPADRPGLIADEPPALDPRWDAFLAAYAEHLSWHLGVAAPDWVFQPGRYLPSMWFAGAPPTMRAARVEAVVHSPAAFEAHGVLLPARELAVV